MPAYINWFKHFRRQQLLKMPKSKKLNKASEESVNSLAQATRCSIIQSDEDSIKIHFHAKPGAKHNAITDISSNQIGIQISAPPVDGDANRELVKYVAAILDVKKSCVSLDKGHKSREKTVIIRTLMNVEDIKQRLTAQLSN